MFLENQKIKEKIKTKTLNTKQKFKTLKTKTKNLKN